MLEPCEGKLSRTVLRGESGSNTADLLDQIQEQKLRYITQILTGKHIARSCEDVDETVLSAAQFKAAATDNPMVAQKMELENRVTELKSCGVRGAMNSLLWNTRLI